MTNTPDEAMEQLRAENAELHRYHSEDQTALTEMRTTIERLREEVRKAKRAADTLAGSHRRAEEAESAVARARVYAHELRHKDAMGLLAVLDSPASEAGHVYLSTSCLHGDQVLPDGRTGHAYCQGDTGHAGSKVPARCKFCAAPCVCACHRGVDPGSVEQQGGTS